MTTDGSRSLLDTPLARLIALLIAIGGIWILWSNWAPEFRDLFAGDPQGIPMAEPQGVVPPVNPALEACLDQRITEVENMKAEGILTDAQYTAFRARAEDLCHGRNPT